MIETNGGTQVVDQLRTLLDRLGSPDLTLAEAKGLRESVLGLVAERAPTGSAALGGRAAPPRELVGAASR